MSKRHSLTAIIYNKRGYPISIGQNSYLKTHPMQAKAAANVGEHAKIYLHAEIAAIVKLPKNAKPHSILITRFNSKGEPVNAAPCPSCHLFLSTFGLQVHHT